MRGSSQKKVIVERCDFEAAVEQRGHHRVDFVLRQDEIAIMTSIPPLPLVIATQPPNPKRRRRLDVRDRDAEIVARDVDLEHARFVVTLFAESREHLLILGGHVLRRRVERERQDDCHAIHHAFHA
jgi:hypothetical protein